MLGRHPIIDCPSPVPSTRCGPYANAILKGTQIRGLDVSFASKHLRMLEPKKYAVLDNVLSKGLGFALNSRGYRFFLSTLRSLHLITRWLSAWRSWKQGYSCLFASTYAPRLLTTSGQKCKYYPH